MLKSEYKIAQIKFIGDIVTRETYTYFYIVQQLIGDYEKSDE